MLDDPFSLLLASAISDSFYSGDIQEKIQNAVLLSGKYVIILDICYNILILFMKYQQNVHSLKEWILV